MPFGLRNAAQTFQRFMDKVLHGLEFCYVYINDLLIASSSPEEHKRHLRLVLERLDAHGIIIIPQKCEFGVSSLNFLGHRVDRWGIHPLEEKVQVIRDFPQRTTQCKLREFLGLVNFYHRFVRHGADILQPLNSLLAAPKDSAKTLLWSDVATTAFSRIKEAVANATILSHPKPEALTCIMTDASNTAVGAVLQQYIDGQWRPISYFSKKLRPPETRYSTFDCELLAIYLAIKHFRRFVEGRVFHISTDHKPLTYAPTTRSDRHSPRQARHLDFVSQFTSDIKHVKGTDNAVADALSRIEANALLDASPPQVDFVAMTEAQRTDPELSELRSLPSSSSLTLPKCHSHWQKVQLCVIHPLEYTDLLYQQFFGVSCSTLFIHSPTQEYVQPSDWSLPGMSGPTSTGTLESGPSHVFTAKEPRSNDTLSLHSPHSNHQMCDLTKSTSTW